MPVGLRVTGVDALPIMVHTARAIAEAAGICSDECSGEGNVGNVRFLLDDAVSMPGDLMASAGLVVLASLAWDAPLRRVVYARLLTHLPDGALVLDYAEPALPSRKAVVPLTVSAAALDAAAGGGSVRRLVEVRSLAPEPLTVGDAPLAVSTSWGDHQSIFLTRMAVDIVDEGAQQGPSSASGTRR